MFRSLVGWRWPRLLLGLALILTAAAGVSRGQAAAESAARLASMAVSVMPEYDQPRVLVSYRGVFDEDVSLPLEVHLRLPGDASIEHVCSIKPPNEEHICQPYSADPDGQYLAVTYEAVTSIMYVEFYYESVSGAGQRSLEFSFWAPFPVQNLDMFVLEPMGASDFALSPAPADTVEEQGFRHHSYSYQDLSVEEPVSVEMVYTRQTGEPSVPPRTAASGGDSGGIPQGLVLSLGLAGAGVLAFVLYGAFARRFRLRLVPMSRQAARDEVSAMPAGTFFCRHCGGKVQQDFSFCPGCGQEVRKPPKEQG